MENKGTNNYDIYLRTRKFSVQILEFCKIAKRYGIDYFLRNQIGRSGTSIGANIHEAKSSSSRKEFCRFYEIALRSGHETMYWLDVINEHHKLDQIELIKKELSELLKIISTIVLRLKEKIKAEDK